VITGVHLVKVIYSEYMSMSLIAMRLKSHLTSRWLSVRLRGRNPCRRRPTLGRMPARRDFNRTAWAACASLVKKQNQPV